MKSLRSWEIGTDRPFKATISADARLSGTDYSDDQTWELKLGNDDDPALVLQTAYGGRVGQVSLVPMWQIGDEIIYETNRYASPPMITQFAPNYLNTSAQIIADVNLQAEYWAMESHVTGGIFTVSNQSNNGVQIRFDLFAHVVSQGKERGLNIVTLGDGSHAIQLGKIGTLTPVVLLENADAEIDETGTARSPKVGRTLTLEAGDTIAMRWVHVGQTYLRDSLKLGLDWLREDWSAHFRLIGQASRAIPTLQTGNKDWDLLIAQSYNRVVQSIIKGSKTQLPHASFVSTREMDDGYSFREGGTDYKRSWSGQDPIVSSQLSLVIASIDADVAKGIVQNYLSTQQEDGWIDRQPGLAGQRQELLIMPLLAQMTWDVYQATQDDGFLKDTFDNLMKCFNRWFEADHDADNDGFPEWQHTRQMGYGEFPLFSVEQPKSQGVSVKMIESPDLLTYLLNEADALRDIATTLGKKRPVAQLNKQIKNLEKHLNNLWDGTRFAYRDRDTHATQTATILLQDARGDEEHFIGASLSEPSRIVVSAEGGVRHIPTVKLTMDGIDSQGNTIQEVANSEHFSWQGRQGVYTSQNIFSQVDRIQCEGLSRVYQITVATVDTTALDINSLLPIMIDDLPSDKIEALVQLITDKKLFWRVNGVPMVSAQDSTYESENGQASRAIGLFWLAQIGTGLLNAGYTKDATTLLKNTLKMLDNVMLQDGTFHQFYDSEGIGGFGETGHLSGIVPLAFLHRVLGAQVVSSSQVWAGGNYAWGRNITIKQFGVTVRRGKKGTKITFPSKSVIELDVDAEWQLVTDPEPIEESPIEHLPQPKIEPSAPKSPKRVMIEVELDDEPTESS